MWLIQTPKIRVFNVLTRIQSMLPRLEKDILAKRIGMRES
jgi:hypothetical protein